MTDEQMNDYYSDKCDYRDGTNEDGTYYDFCNQCYRYDTCKSAFDKVNKKQYAFQGE